MSKINKPRQLGTKHGTSMETVAGMNLATILNEVVGAVRDMLREVCVTKLCAQRAGPLARDPPPLTRTQDSCRAMHAPPVRGGADAFRSRETSVASSRDRVWPTLVCTLPAPVRTRIPAMPVDEIRMNPNESCLAQRFISTPYSDEGPAMMGGLPRSQEGF